jgi:hypothetical protein
MKEASTSDHLTKEASMEQRSIEALLILDQPPLGTEIEFSTTAGTGGKEKVAIVITDLDTTVRGYITG